LDMACLYVKERKIFISSVFLRKTLLKLVGRSPTKYSLCKTLPLYWIYIQYDSHCSLSVFDILLLLRTPLVAPSSAQKTLLAVDEP
jgi:hypothetical protein